MKLHPIPAYVLAASCAFDNLHAMAEAVATIRMMGVPVSRIEVLDEMSIRAFNQSLLSATGGRDASMTLPKAYRTTTHHHCG